MHTCTSHVGEHRQRVRRIEGAQVFTEVNLYVCAERARVLLRK